MSVAAGGGTPVGKDRNLSSPASKLSTTRYQRLQQHHHHDKLEDGDDDLVVPSSTSSSVVDQIVEVITTTTTTTTRVGDTKDRDGGSALGHSPAGAIFRSRGTTTTSSSSGGNNNSNGANHNNNPLNTSSLSANSHADKQRPSWTTAIATNDELEKERRSDDEEEDDDGTDGGGGGGSSSVNNKSHSRSSRQSLVLSPDNSRDWEDDDDDDLQDDDDDMIRRYHHVIVHTRVPTLPAEFMGREGRGSHAGLLRWGGGTMGGGGGTAARCDNVWAALAELRQGARQRRAARLLNPNSRQNDFCQTWFCDATDRGIALAAVLTALWLVTGVVASAGAWYWWIGLLLFGVRVSARTAYEALQERKRRRKRNSSMMPTSSNNGNNNINIIATHHGNALEMSSARDHSNGVGGTAKTSNHYRDQERPLTGAPMV